jgi:non-specific serine/threonine protein kinase
MELPGSHTQRERRAVTAEWARAALGLSAFESAWSDGLELSPGQAVREVERFVLDSDPGTSPGIVSAPFGFTRREREVAELLAQGLTNREIAQALVLSERTVETHVTHLLGKLGVRSRAQAAVRLSSVS